MRLYRTISLAGMLALAAAGCQSSGSAPRSGSTAPPEATAAYERALEAWVNRSEADLVATWGVPERSQRLTDGGQAMQYVRRDGDGHVLCTTLLTSDMTGMIRTWSFRGSDCRVPHLGDYGTS